MTNSKTNSDSESVDALSCTPSFGQGNKEPTSSGVRHGAPQQSEHTAHVLAYMASREHPNKADCWRANKACSECLAIARADLRDDPFFEWDVQAWESEQEA